MWKQKKVRNPLIMKAASVKKTDPTIYSYVVEHDNGHAPNPYFDFCTLCRCKYRIQPTGRKNIVELAKEGDWIVGTGGASDRSAQHGKLIYAMRVDEKITRGEYFDDRRFAAKRRAANGAYERTRGDNEWPKSKFERNEQFALVSSHFYYFGAKAIDIPERFKHFEKKGPGFRSHFDQTDIHQFLRWLTKRRRLGKQGEPCYQELPKGMTKCGSSC
jgi:hypothetical protein